ncbi:MAG: PilZ domain-containing protein [Deltaproteobacteria bacterium]|nr:PilZ domain-containing protein [Deltaproteobacteria bacterium]
MPYGQTHTGRHKQAQAPPVCRFLFEVLCLASKDPGVKKMWRYLEQRLYKRRSVNLNAEIGVEIKKGNVVKKYLLPVKVINLSLQGCCFITDTILLNGKHLFLEDIGSKKIDIQIYLSDNLIKTLAKVIWFDYTQEYKKFKVGLNFEFMEDINMKFLKQYLSLKNSALKQ